MFRSRLRDGASHSHIVTDASRIPRLLPLPAGKLLRDYPLGPIDGYLISRVDGQASVADLIAITGLTEPVVSASLDKLVELKLATCERASVAPKTPPATASSPRIEAVKTKPVSEQPAARRRSSMGDLRRDDLKPPRALYDPSEIDEDVDLDRALRQRILDVFHGLEALDYYALLGIPAAADKKSIKRAYYALATEYHPDKFFGKRLGSFKSKMEAVFGRMTLAHDTLTRRDLREDYDRYLDDRSKTEKHEASQRAPIAATATVLMPASPEPPTDAASARAAADDAAPKLTVSDQSRRDAFARRLVGSRHAHAPPAPAAPITHSIDPDALRRHYEDRVSGARDRVIAGHLTAAEAALERDDAAAAASACRQALELTPPTHDLRPALESVLAAATTELGESYRRQAAFQEKSALWKDAAKSWANAVKCLPDDAAAHDRAAAALLKANGNLHEAAQLATRAAKLSPDSVTCRVTLAQIYVAAGLNLNAKRELEAALLLAPGDATVVQLLKHVGK